MEIYLILLLSFLLLLFGIGFWIYKIVIFYKTKRTKKATYNLLFFTIILLGICWELRIIPLSQNFDFKNQTEKLTGKSFWCWNDYRYEEFGIRGEGFTFDIYELNDEMANYFANPNQDFFKKYPNKNFETSNWKETPILDTVFINYITPTYANWSPSLRKELEAKQNIVKQIVSEKGSYYSISRTNGNDLYLISPKRKLIIYINHNM